MRETIRYEWEMCSLGDFIVALSDKGIVTLEFGSNRLAMEDALSMRFPDADIVAARDELAPIVEKLDRTIEDPRFDPALSLDLRGRPYEVQVWTMLQTIPMGETTS